MKGFSKSQGIAMVTGDPSAYSLMPVADHQQALLDANQTAKVAIENAKLSSKAEGVAAVTNDPIFYNLMTVADLNRPY